MVFWTESRVQSYSRSRVTVGREGISRVPGGHSLHAETGGQPPCLPSAGPTPTVTQLRAQGDQVQHGTAEPIQPGHHQHIPFPQDPQHQVQLRARGIGAAAVTSPLRRGT
jgi:hypothetical protein